MKIAPWPLHHDLSIKPWTFTILHLISAPPSNKRPPRINHDYYQSSLWQNHPLWIHLIIFFFLVYELFINCILNMTTLLMQMVVAMMTIDLSLIIIVDGFADSIWSKRASQNKKGLKAVESKLIPQWMWKWKLELELEWECWQRWRQWW